MLDLSGDSKDKKYSLKLNKKEREMKEEVIYIFEKVLEGWKTIRIYNTIIQNNPDSGVCKKHVENIATGNSKVYETELSKERYEIYEDLRQKVYVYIKSKDIIN